MASPLWFVTGASGGMGLLLSLKALKSGHRVVASMRSPVKSSDAAKSIQEAGGHVVGLDMTESRDNIIKTIQDVEKEFGSIDFLVNNAGYSELGAAELFTEVEANNQMKTNLFGPMYSTQAVLPGMRARRTGTIVSVSSVAGQDAQPTCSIYAASKFALEGFNEALAREVKEFGVSVLIVEPGAFRTNFLAASNIGDITGYEDGIVGQTAKKFREANGKQPGDPRKAVEIIYEVATGEGAAGHLKGQILRLPLGPDCFTRVQNKVNSVQHDLDVTREIGSTTNL